MRSTRIAKGNASSASFSERRFGMILRKNTGLNPGWWQLLSQPPHGFAACGDGEIVLRLHLLTPCSPADASVLGRPLPQRPQGDLHIRFGCAPPVAARSRPFAHHEGLPPAPTSARPTPSMGGHAASTDGKPSRCDLLRVRQKPPATSIASSAHSADFIQFSD